jgi:hypothetical protein
MSVVPTSRESRSYTATKFIEPEGFAGAADSIFKPAVRNQVNGWGLPYKQGPFTIRIWPGVCRESPSEFDPYRWPADDPLDPLGWGDWIRHYPAVRGMGNPPVTFIQYDYADPNAGDPQMTPAWLLYRNIDQAVTASQERPGWAQLLRGSNNRRAQLSKPSEMYMVQGAVISFKGRFYSPPKGFADNDKLIVVHMPVSAGAALLNCCNAEVPNYQGDPNDFEHRYVNGDPIALDHGRFTTFYSLPEGDPRQVQQQQAPQGWQQQAGVRASGPQQQQEPMGYGCFMEPVFANMSASMTPVKDVVRSKTRLWDDLLWFPTLEEQARILATRFPPDVIMYAWQSHPDWIPEEVVRRARAQTVVGMPGPQASYPGPGPAQVYAGPAEQPRMAPPHQQPYQQPYQQSYQPPQPAQPNWPGNVAGAGASATAPVMRPDSAVPGANVIPPAEPPAMQQPPAQPLAQPVQQTTPGITPAETLAPGQGGWPAPQPPTAAPDGGRQQSQQPGQSWTGAATAPQAAPQAASGQSMQPAPQPGQGWPGAAAAPQAAPQPVQQGPAPQPAPQPVQPQPQPAPQPVQQAAPQTGQGWPGAQLAEVTSLPVQQPPPQQPPQQVPPQQPPAPQAGATATPPPGFDNPPAGGDAERAQAALARAQQARQQGGT